MAKKRASKIHEEDEEQYEQLSINNIFEDKASEELMSINFDLEQEKSETTDLDQVEQLELLNEEALQEHQKKASEEEAAMKGIKIPPAKANRDPKKDKDPIEGEDLGLEENDFLLSRKITEKDLEIHNKIKKEKFLGSNVRKPRDFMEVFLRGPSTKELPKVDTMYAIENNRLVQKEIAATQVLRNYHSRDSKERNNMQHLLNELQLDEEILKEIKEDKNAHQNQNLIDLIKEML